MKGWLNLQGDERVLETVLPTVTIHYIIDKPYYNNILCITFAVDWEWWMGGGESLSYVYIEWGSIFCNKPMGWELFHIEVG